MDVSYNLELMMESLNRTMNRSDNPYQMLNADGTRNIGHYYLKTRECDGYVQLQRIETENTDLMVSMYFMSQESMEHYIRGMFAGYCARYKIDQELGFIPR